MSIAPHAPCPTCATWPDPDGHCACAPRPQSPAGFGAGVSPGFSASAAVDRQLAAERDATTWQDRYTRSSATSFALTGRILLTLPAVLLALAMLVLLIKLPNAAVITLVILGWGGFAYYLKSIWMPKR